MRTTVLFFWSSVDFLFGQPGFYIGQLVNFYLVNVTFYMVKNRLFIWSTNALHARRGYQYNQQEAVVR